MKDWSKQTVVQLKAELKRRGLAIAGLKQDLVSRLTEDDASNVAAENEAEASEPEPAENSEPQAVEAEEPSADSASVDEAPKESAHAEPDAAPAEPETAPAPESAFPISKTNSDAPAVAPESDDKQDAPAALQEGVPSAEITPPAPAEIAQDAQKRKRRSESPAEPLEDASRKRLKAQEDDEVQSSEPSGVTGVISNIKDALVENTSLAEDITNDAKAVSENVPQPEDEPMEQDEPKTKGDVEDVVMTTNDEAQNEPATTVADDSVPAPESADIADQTKDANDTQSPIGQGAGDAMEYERDVQPSVHPATRALYIKNFMRPLRENVVQAHLLELATPAGTDPNEGDIEEFFVDQIRTHAFAVFKTTSQASRVRNALHDVIWPDERERKPLWVDFVPPEKVREWIDEEETQGHSRRGARWEVIFDREDDGFVVARLDSGSAPPPALAGPEPTRPIPSGPAVKDVNAIPLGPRARGTEGAPLGPRGDRDPPRGPGGRGSRQIQNFPGGPVQTTRKNPPITFQPVSDDLASRRIRNMRSFYTQDLKRDMGPETEINRYTFEQGDSFVDRGQEVFVGIRPPHRERDAQRRRGFDSGPHRGSGPRRNRRNGGGGGGGGGGGNGRRNPRPLSDRYLPGINEGGPYRQGDRGTFGSRSDDRERRY
ncbi:SAP domain-containing protein [Colletotrichum asianum]|uniref:SAP domain-containing protein n=1 Tax=Colletotrichum asianum TaxID=702518 RepID=A0A8H3WK86_9PEZI|nr:SAP domain-containing protein [Colletotrichum asianum]